MKLDKLGKHTSNSLHLCMSHFDFVCVVASHSIKLISVLFQREAQEREEAEQFRLEQMRKEQEEEKEVRRTAVHTSYSHYANYLN